MFGHRQGFNLEANFLPQDHHYACKTNDTLHSKESRNISRFNLIAWQQGHTSGVCVGGGGVTPPIFGQKLQKVGPINELSQVHNIEQWEDVNTTI